MSLRLPRTNPRKNRRNPQQMPPITPDTLHEFEIPITMFHAMILLGMVYALPDIEIFEEMNGVASGFAETLDMARNDGNRLLRRINKRQPDQLDRTVANIKNFFERDAYASAMANHVMGAIAAADAAVHPDHVDAIKDIILNVPEGNGAAIDTLMNRVYDIAGVPAE
jgi:hypothetical protein